MFSSLLIKVVESAVIRAEALSDSGIARRQKFNQQRNLQQAKCEVTRYDSRS